jgi:hypothetical protein
MLTLTYKQEKELKDDLLLAKRYENDIYERVTRKIESEELNKISTKRSESVEEDKRKMRTN